jgi:thioredoxin reductase (NADPH)
VLITGGIGTFEPRPLPGAADFPGTGLLHFVPRLDELAGLDVVVVGGGDSALDWALALESIADSVALVHRRTAFRAHDRTVKDLESSSVRVLTPYEVERLHHNHDDGHVRAVEVHEVPDGARETLPAQAVIAALGFVADLGPFARWGLELRRRRILVDSKMRTNLDRVYAAGDVVEYDGKVRLISVGFGEAAIAVNNAAVQIDPSKHLFPGHSTDL